MAASLIRKIRTPKRNYRWWRAVRLHRDKGGRSDQSEVGERQGRPFFRCSRFSPSASFLLTIVGHNTMSILERRSPCSTIVATNGRRPGLWLGCGGVANQFLTPEFTRMAANQRAGIASLQEAFLLFRRLGIDVPSLSAQEFTAAYFNLAKRYHPDIGNQDTEQLMANINVARAIILTGYRRA